MPKKLDITKLKLLLRLSVNRLKIHRNKQTELGNLNKKEIAELLRKGKDELARVKTVSVIYEDYMVEVFNMIELYMETLISRVNVLGTSNQCPIELKKEVCSLIYAAPFIDNPELSKARNMLISHFGKKLPEECIDCGCVDLNIIARLRRDQPDEALINYYLSTIAKKHNIDWALPLPSALSSPLPSSASASASASSSTSTSTS